MKIGIDLRFVGDNIYSNFILELVKELILSNEKNFYTIYTNGKMFNFGSQNMRTKSVMIGNGSIKEQLNLYKTLKDDNNDLMLFFNHFKPLLYKGDYITFLVSLKDVYYQEFDNTLKKHIYLYCLEKNLVNSKRVVCFDENTKNELIERFNLEENKINIITPFFPKKNSYKNIEDIDLDIGAKFGIQNKYLIYSAGDGIEKNTEKLLLLINKLKKDNIELDLVFLGGKISKNINLRNLIIKYSLQKNIHFLGIINDNEKSLIYKNSLGVIFPSLYEPFPFRLLEPLVFKKHIICSNLKNIKDMLGENEFYFSPISTNSIYEVTKKFIEKHSEPEVNEKNKEILEKYTRKNTLNEVIKVINYHD